MRTYCVVAESHLKARTQLLPANALVAASLWAIRKQPHSVESGVRSNRSFRNLACSAMAPSERRSVDRNRTVHHFSVNSYRVWNADWNN